MEKGKGMLFMYCNDTIYVNVMLIISQNKMLRKNRTVSNIFSWFQRYFTNGGDVGKCLIINKNVYICLSFKNKKSAIHGWV